MSTRSSAHRHLRLVALILLTGISAFVLAPADTYSQTRTWSAISPGNLLTGSNWSGGVAPNGIGHTAIISSQPLSPGNFTLNGSMVLGALEYTNSNLIGGVPRTISGSAGQLTIQNSSGFEGNIDVSGTFALGIYVPVVIPNPLHVHVEIPEVYLTLGDPVSGSGSIRKTGVGYLWLRNSNNSYSGLNDIQLGILVGDSIANQGTNSAFGRGNFRLADYSTLEYTGPSASTNRTIQLVKLNEGNVGDYCIIKVSDADSVLSLNGVISGVGTLAKIGPGTLQLNAANTYTNSSAHDSLWTAIGEGRLKLGGNERIPNNSSMDVLSGAVFDLNGFTQTIRTLAGKGDVQLGSGHLRITDSPSFDFEGKMSGAGAITILDGGSASFKGTNSYSGVNTVAGGTFWGDSITDQGVDSAFGRGNFVLSDGGTLIFGGLTGSTNRTITLNGGGNIVVQHPDFVPTFSSLEVRGFISGTGGLTVSGFGRLTLSGLNSYTGTNKIEAGLLSGSFITNDGSNSAFGRGGFLLTDGGWLEYTGPTVSTNRAIGVSDGGGTVSVTSPGTVLTLTGNITGAGDFEAVGPGILQLNSVNNSYNGETFVNHGTLRLGNSEVIPNVSNVRLLSGTLNLNSYDETIGSLEGDGNVTLGAGHLAVGVNNDSTFFSGVVSGSGRVTKTGTGRFSISNDNTYSGGTRIKGGWLVANNIAGSATGSGPVTVEDFGVLSGWGIVHGTVEVNQGGILSPGDGIGELKINNELTFLNGSSLYYSMNSEETAPEWYSDLVTVDSNISIQAGSRLDLNGAALFPPGTKLAVISYSGGWDGGEFAGAADDQLFFSKGRAYRINYDDTEAGVNGGLLENNITLTTTAYYAPLHVAGPTGYDSATGNGFQGQSNPPPSVNGSGLAVGSSQKYAASANLGFRALRWDVSGMAAVELGTLGTDANGRGDARANAVNNAGTTVGSSTKYVSGADMGYRAVRWDTAGTSATELGHLGALSSGFAYAEAFAVNTAGTTVGWSKKYASGNDLGYRAARWSASGTAATELGILGADPSGFTYANANAINDAGTAAGWVHKYVSGNFVGYRAVRWAASGTAATELGNLGTDSDGNTNTDAGDINDAGTIVGSAEKYVSGNYRGERAVRWAAAGTAATELGHIGTDADGTTIARAFAVNAAGTAVGIADKYMSGSNMGYRAVRWAATGTAASELGNLGTDSSGRANGRANAVNDAGTAVGWAQKYIAGNLLGAHAVAWLPDASAIDLNELGVLPAPADGTWILDNVHSITADGWVAGYGVFTPNIGSAYARQWVAQVGLGGEWTNGLSGSLDGTWGRGRQWSTGTPAMLVGNAVFKANATYTVELDRNESTRSIAVNSGHVTVNLNGNTLSALLGTTIAVGASLEIGSSGSAMVHGDVTNSGTFAPGISVGTINIAGDFAQTMNGNLQIELASPQDFDRLQISGNATLAGSLEVLLLDGYMPEAGTEFNIFGSSGVTTLLDGFGLILPALDDSLVWDIFALETSGILRVNLVGDYNKDNTVDAADYVVWRKNDGTTNGYNRWRSNFGASAQNGNSSSRKSSPNLPVPEPSSLLLLCIALGSIMKRRPIARTIEQIG